MKGNMIEKTGAKNRQYDIVHHGTVAKLLAASFVLFLLTMQCAHGQDTINFIYKTYGLEKAEDNVIQNAAHLDDFFEKLYTLKTTGEGNINIVHIGDSHIQADYLTDAVRKDFQKEFGNAGRGLIVPARVAGTNEAFNILTSSDVMWNAKRCVYPDQPLPIGIGGITISTDQPGAVLSVYMKDLWLDYAFNTVMMFYQKDITGFYYEVKDTADHVLGFMGDFTDEPYANYSKIILPHTVSALKIRAIKTTPDQIQGTIFGINLTNGKSGVLYHAIGVNGAKYAHYNAAMFFAEQTAALRPDLFILSLGTNESLDYPYIDKNFAEKVDKLVTSLRTYNPDTKFILVTPPDAFRKRRRVNPGIEIIRQQIIQYAVENGLAFWDMYKALGGSHSAKAWKEGGFLRPDGVHFTKDGYAYQGDLLYDAIMKGYNDYVPVRHP